MDEDVSFLFVDRILGYERGRWIQGSSRIPGARNPLLGPYLLLEALAQSAGWLIAASSDFTKRGLPLSIRSIQLAGSVPVRDPVLLEAEVVAWRKEAALIRGRASVDGRPLAEIDEGLCVLVPAERLEDPEQTRAMFSLLSTMGRGGESSGTLDCGFGGTTVTSDDGWPAWGECARIEELQGGRRARAIWNVSSGEEWLHDHFPNLAIVPGTLQVQAMVELARLLARLEKDRLPALRKIAEVKLRRFVRPGDRLAVKAEALSVTCERASITVEGVMEGKRVASIGEVQFCFQTPHVVAPA